MSEITRMMQAVENGDPKAAEELLPIVYQELRRLAAQKLAHEKPGQTLQATALVHEAWLRLVHEEKRQYRDSRQFLFAAAKAMRRILIDNARRKQAAKYGNGAVPVPADSLEIAAPMPPDELLAVHEALADLAVEDPEAARLVELRFFAGLGHQEAAAVMDISRRTADGLWAFARVWLFQKIRGANPA